MKPRNWSDRRDFLRQSLSIGTALALPTIIPAQVLGKDGAAAPSERITLGAIGIGSRCTYDLKAMLGLSDVRCVAIADVQASRRDAVLARSSSGIGGADFVRDFVHVFGFFLTSRRRG